MYSENYPFDQPIWNVNDQNYWCKMVNNYRYPVTSVREPYRYIIEQGRCSTFEAEYQAYLNGTSTQTETQTSEQPPEV